MRPVNLIPPEDRRGDRAPLRAGSLSYVVVGTCAAMLAAVVTLVVTQNTITERQNEIAELEVARDAAAQRAEALAPYAEFASLQQQREATIASLAESRFDWERVLRELALVIPGDVHLDSLEASTTGGSADGATAGAVAAPSLLLSGCADGHEAVAAFVAALEDIDGVTRVGLESSSKDSEDAPAGGGAAASGAECSAGPDTAKFSLTAVFDGAAPGAVLEAATPAAPAAPAAETNSQEEQVEESRNAANLVPGVVK